MTKKALLIGCNYFNSRAELRGCINDVFHVKQFLKTEYQFEDTEIRIMTDASDLPQNAPTKKNILEGFKWLVENNTSESKLFIHYSGHGSQQWDKNGDEKDGRDETICPIDYATAGMIVDDQINDVLIKPLVSGAQLVGIFDCCHSGSICDIKYSYQVTTTGTNTTYTINSDSNYKSSQANVIMLSGCMDRQTSSDAYIQGQFQGAMTYSFLKAYETLNREGKPVTYKRLMKNLLLLIKEKGFTQVPQISSGRFVDLSEEVKIA